MLFADHKKKKRLGNAEKLLRDDAKRILFMLTTFFQLRTLMEKMCHIKIYCLINSFNNVSLHLASWQVEFGRNSDVPYV